MGTQGAYGLRVEGRDIIFYSNCDSYPSWLGAHLVEEIRVADLDQWRQQALVMHAVDQDAEPSDEHVRRCEEADSINTGVDTQRPSGKPSYYQLLRLTQGSIAQALAVGIYIDAADFLGDGLYCMWAYIVNLDEGGVRGLPRLPAAAARPWTLRSPAFVGQYGHWKDVLPGGPRRAVPAQRHSR